MIANPPGAKPGKKPPAAASKARGALAARVSLLETKIETLAKQGSILVPITTLDARYVLTHPIQIVVQQTDDEDFLATFFDANVNASGCNQVEAVNNLKEMLVTRLEYLDPLPPRRLGPMLRRQVRVLRSIIRRA